MYLTSNTYYVTNLYLNGNATNITLSNSTPLNVTTYTNITGLNSTILFNGTVYAWNNSNASNISYLSAGLWNITFYVFNASTNASVTLWANMTYTPSIPVTPNVNNFSYNICSSDTLLFKHETTYNNGTFNYTDETILCHTGCDNSTKACNPDEETQALYILIILVVATIGLLALRKLVRGKGK